MDQQELTDKTKAYLAIAKKYAVKFYHVMYDWNDRLMALGYAGLFVVYSIIVLGGITWVLSTLRASTDPYIAVPLDFGSILFLLLPISLAIYVVIPLIKRLKKDTGLQNHGAVITLLCVIEVLALYPYAEDIFTRAPRSHRAEELTFLQGYFANGNKELPQKMNDFITLKRMNYNMMMASFMYDITEKEGYAWNQEKMDQQLKPKACYYFKDLTKYGGIQLVQHLFYQGETIKFRMAYRPEDCDLKGLKGPTRMLGGMLPDDNAAATAPAATAPAATSVAPTDAVPNANGGVPAAPSPTVNTTPAAIEPKETGSVGTTAPGATPAAPDVLAPVIPVAPQPTK